MQNKVRTHFYNPKRQQSDYKKDDISFQNFLLLIQLKNHKILKENRKKMKQYQALKNKLQNKIKIVPLGLAEGLKEYDSQLNQQALSRKISKQYPRRRTTQNQLPRIKRSCQLQILPNLNKYFRLDEINSIRSYSYKLNPKVSNQKIKSNKPKIIIKRHRTDYLNESKELSVNDGINAQKLYRKKLETIQS